MCNVLVILERSGKIKSGDADLYFTHFLGELPPLPPLPDPVEQDVGGGRRRNRRRARPER